MEKEVKDMGRGKIREVSLEEMMAAHLGKRLGEEKEHFKQRA